VHLQPPTATPFQDALLDRDVFLGFTEHYLAHRIITRDFEVNDAVLKDFKQYLSTQDIDYTPKDFSQNLEWVKVYIKSSLFETQFGETAALRVRANWDPEIQQGIGLMSQAAQLEQRALKVDAEKEAALDKGPAQQ
jgi:carboxyl-terminal processing protease